MDRRARRHFVSRGRVAPPLHALAQHWLGSIAGRFDDLFGEYVCLGHMSNGEGVYRKRH
jgi:hypothetical protein